MAAGISTFFAKAEKVKITANKKVKHRIIFIEVKVLNLVIKIINVL